MTGLMKKTAIAALLAAGVLSVGLPAAMASVDIEYMVDTDQWQRNGVYDLTVRLVNTTSSPIEIAGVQVDYNYASAHFKDIAPALIQDYITGYDFAVDLIDTSNEGIVLYSKLIAEAAAVNSFTLAGNGTQNVVKFRYRPQHLAPLGNSNFTFRAERSVLKRLAAGGTESVLGTVHPLTVTIVEDTTPPNTYASPGSRTIKYGESTLVALKEVAVPAYDDLDRVYFEVGEGEVPGPTTGSSWVAKDGTVQLPYNDESHPGQISVQLKYFGQDTTGNLEYGGTSWHTENYIVDVIRPGFTAGPSRSPERVKLGETIAVEFTVNEPLASDPLVRVDGNSFTKAAASSGNFYRYTYEIQGGETEGNRTIEIRVTDLAGNLTVNTSLKVVIDMTPPTYSPVSFLPEECEPGQTLTITFDASETLDTALTEVTVAPGYNGGAAVYQGHSGLRYTYTYGVTGLEESTFVQVKGYDLAGNTSYNTDGWGEIVVEGYDQYGNWGMSTGVVNIELVREAY